MPIVLFIVLFLVPAIYVANRLQKLPREASVRWYEPQALMLLGLCFCIVAIIAREYRLLDELSLGETVQFFAFPFGFYALMFGICVSHEKRSRSQ